MRKMTDIEYKIVNPGHEATYRNTYANALKLRKPGGAISHITHYDNGDIEEKIIKEKIMTELTHKSKLCTANDLCLGGTDGLFCGRCGAGREKTTHRVMRDGSEKFRGSEQRCHEYILGHQSQSVEWATTYEGWAIEEL